MSGYPCLGVTYLSWDLDEDGLLRVLAECNREAGLDCGWHEDQTDELGLTSAGFTDLSKRHMAHRAAVHDRSQTSTEVDETSDERASDDPAPEATDG